MQLKFFKPISNQECPAVCNNFQLVEMNKSNKSNWNSSIQLMFQVVSRFQLKMQLLKSQKYSTPSYGKHLYTLAAFLPKLPETICPSIYWLISLAVSSGSKTCLNWSNTVENDHDAIRDVLNCPIFVIIKQNSWKENGVEKVVIWCHLLVSGGSFLSFSCLRCKTHV